MDQPLDHQPEPAPAADAPAPMPPPPPTRPAPAVRPPAPAKKGWGGCVLILVGVAMCLALVVGLAVVGVFGLGAFAALGQGIAKPNAQMERIYSGNAFAKEKIAMIDVRGIILSYGDGWSQIATATSICDQIQQASEDDAVRAIVLRIDSPGGEVTASDLIYHRVRQAREDYGKVVVAVMESVAASGGLYVAVGADRIVAHRMTTTGSIGVIAQTYNYHLLMEKVGLQSETYKSGPMKDMLSGSRPRTEGERVFMNQHIRTIYEEFVRIVAAGRPTLAVADILDTEIGDGRILTGQQAYECGLVDELGYFEDGVALAEELSGIGEDYKLVYYEPPFSFSSLFSMRQSAPKVSVELPGGNGHPWSRLIEPGKVYFLPSL
jgi:protease-4